MRDEPSVRRLYQIYLYAVCLVTLVLAVVSLSKAAFDVVRIAAPDTTKYVVDNPYGFPGEEASDEDERDRGLAGGVQQGLIGLVSGLVFFAHWNRTENLREEALEAEEQAAAKPKPRRKAAPRKPRA